MAARIEVVEVRDFRLELPRHALEALPERLAGVLEVRLGEEDGQLVLAPEGGECFLRFAPRGPAVELAEVVVCNDAGGRFFRHVLGALMVQHGGDLDARVVYDVAEVGAAEDAEEAWAEVRNVVGRTAFPGLATQGAAVNLAQAAADAGPAGAPEEDEDAHAPPPEDDEVGRLLERAREQWQEYQRLKAQRPGG